MYISTLGNHSKVIGESFPKSKICVAHGFEDEQNFRADFQTYTREGVRSLLACIATHRCKVNSTDTKTAFLQGKTIERTI